MTSHYEILGVSPTASDEEIRRAYLRRARALHPDRQLGRPEREAKRAERAMQQVNVAWNVLSDPKKKSEYDGRARPQPSVAAQAPRRPAAGGAPPRAPRPRQPEPQYRYEPPERTIDQQPGDGTVSIWASIPVLIGVGLLLGILLISAFAGGEPSDNRPIVPESRTELSEGDCFRFVGSALTPHSCNSGTADGQVAAIVPSAGNCPANTTSIPDPTSDLFLCWARMIPGSTNTVP